MALVHADRVKETSTTTGTGTYTLAGAVTGFQSFAAVGNGNTCYYTAENGTDWEVGIGTYTSSGTTLARTSILASSNAGAAVSWGAGTKNIFVTLPSSKFRGKDTPPVVRTYLSPASPATWTKPAGLVAVRVRLSAGGVAGGPVEGPSPSPTNLAGDGGASGGYAEELIPAPTIPGPVAIAIPAPGTVSFGPFLSATAGSGTGSPGSAGTGTGGDLNIPGQIGETGTAGTFSGRGAGSMLGLGGVAIFAPAPGGTVGNAGAGHGSGGSGALKSSGIMPATKAGGAAGPPIVIVEELY